MRSILFSFFQTVWIVGISASAYADMLYHQRPQSTQDQRLAELERLKSTESKLKGELATIETELRRIRDEIELLQLQIAIDKLASEGVLAIAAGNYNVFSGPSLLSSRSIGQLKAGSAVKVVEYIAETKFYKIVYEQGYGYIPEDAVKPTSNLREMVSRGLAEAQEEEAQRKQRDAEYERGKVTDRTPSASSQTSRDTQRPGVETITTIQKFESSPFYRDNGFKSIDSLREGRLGYHSPSSNIIIGFHTEKGRIVEARLAYSEDKIPSGAKLRLHITDFVSLMVGASKASAKEYSDLEKMILDRLTDKARTPFSFNSRTITIGIIDAPNPYASQYLGVIVSIR